MEDKRIKHSTMGTPEERPPSQPTTLRLTPFSNSFHLYIFKLILIGAFIPMFLNLAQSGPVGLKAFKPAANGCYYHHPALLFMVTWQKYFYLYIHISIYILSISPPPPPPPPPQLPGKSLSLCLLVNFCIHAYPCSCI